MKNFQKNYIALKVPTLHDVVLLEDNPERKRCSEDIWLMLFQPKYVHVGRAVRGYFPDADAPGWLPSAGYYVHKWRTMTCTVFIFDYGEASA